jgi:hypothetical protein
MRNFRFAVPLLLLTLALVILGCGGQSLSDGEHFGLVRQVTADSITFDPAVVLTGQAALDAARADGAIGPNETLDSDFYISLVEPHKVQVKVNPAASVMLLVSNTSPMSDEVVTYSQFVRFWQGTEDATRFYGPLGVNAELGSGALPMNVTVWNGQVQSGKQFYLP